MRKYPAHQWFDEAKGRLAAFLNSRPAVPVPAGTLDEWEAEIETWGARYDEWHSEASLVLTPLLSQRVRLKLKPSRRSFIENECYSLFNDCERKLVEYYDAYFGDAKRLSIPVLSRLTAFKSPVRERMNLADTQASARISQRCGL